MLSKMIVNLVSLFAVLVFILSSLTSAGRTVHWPLSRHDRLKNKVASSERRLPSHQLHDLVDNMPQMEAVDGACVNKAPRTIQAPKKNVWWGLTHEEEKDVKEFLKSQREFNVTKNSPNYIYDIQLMAPNKTDVLPYLDENGKAPARYAQAIIEMKDPDSNIELHMQYVLVGPLPVVHGKTTWKNLSFPFTKKSDGRIRDLSGKDEKVFEHWLHKLGKEVADITLDLWNGTAAGHRNDTLSWSGIDPLWQDDGIVEWFSLYGTSSNYFSTGTLAPLGLYVGMNMTAKNYKDYEMLGWLYNDEFFHTTEEFRKAYFSKKLPRLPAANATGEWSITDQHGPKPPLDHFYPPTLMAPSGSRFFVDEEEKYVRWMEFEFFYTFNQDTGLRLFDIKFRGKRILYELGMQEALAHYAGNDPVQSSTAYLDSYYGFGYNSFDLIPGYDCPSYATFLEDGHYHAPQSSPRGGPICLFEMDAGYPISRHNAGNYIAATKNIYLTLRSISTIGNYDYLFDYSFYMDGSMGVEVRASGYIQAGYFAKNEEYGWKIHTALSGSMHDHVLNFKADFDIDGVENTMQLVKNVPISQVYPWSAGKPRNTFKLEREDITSEDHSKLFWAPNGATQHIIMNKDKKNEWGESPGFRIYPANGAIHLTAKHSSNLGKAAEWSSHDLFVTKQKDTEPRSANPNNNQDTPDPLINFNEFFDGDNLEQTDLVTWFNLGMHHVPNTGDLPITVYSTAHSGVHFQPINYFRGSPTTQTVNMVRVKPKKGGPQVVLFGQEQGMCSLNYQSQTNFMDDRIGYYY